MTTYHELIKAAEERVARSDASVSAVRLLMYELTQDRGIDLYMDYNEAVDGALEQLFLADIARLIDQEPLAYILGYQWFYGRKFSVNREVFIPRYETEELCAHILREIDTGFPGSAPLEAADVATGSGAIAITLACEEPRLRMHATELNPQTLTMARTNALANAVEIDFQTGDMVQPLITAGLKLDVLVSNPPYIAADEKLDRSVVDFEPPMALFGGNDGLRFYREIFEQAPKVLKARALMAFEIGYQQREPLLDLVRTYYPDQRAEVRKDLNGKDRMLFVYINM